MNRKRKRKLPANVIDLDSRRPSPGEAEHLAVLVNQEREEARRLAASALTRFDNPPPKPPWRLDAEKEFERNGYDWYREVPGSAIERRAEEIRREKYE